MSRRSTLKTATPKVATRSHAAAKPPTAAIRLASGHVDGADHARHAGGHYVRDPVFEQDGALCLRIDGHALPILSDHQPVAGFLEGWRATALYSGFAPLLLLEFRSDAGSYGLWFLDHQLNRIGGQVSDLSPPMLRLLKLQAAPLLGRLLDQALRDCAPSLDPGLRDFLELHEEIRAAIAEACIDLLAPAPILEHSGSLMQRLIPLPGQDRVLRSIDRSHLAAGFAIDWQDRQAACLAAGRMNWPSPVDGAAVPADGSLPLDDLHILYRFSDPSAQLVFLVLVCGPEAEAIGVWFPSANLVVSRDHHHQKLVAARFVPRFPSLAHHVVRWGALLVPSLGRGFGASPA